MTAQKRPNLLFVYTDEQAMSTMAAYGEPRIQTPNLNRFASQSTVFDRAYVTQPVCTPSRSSLLTGLYPHTTGLIENNIPLPADVPCLPEMLRQGEYATAHHGKWHLGDEIFAQHGFEEWVSIDDGYRRHYSEGRDREARSTYHHWLVENGFSPQNGEAFNRSECARLPEEFGKPAYLAREASRFIRQNKDRPFALFVNIFEPHMPYFGPRDSQHDPAEVSLPANFDAWPTEDQPLKARLFASGYRERGHSGLPLKSEADWRRMIANYWGLCSLVDTHFGTILDTLDECGLADDTIVVFTSDHGDMMGSHRLLAKCVMFEEAARVPMIVRLPGQNGQRWITGPFGHADVVPTLLDLMGQEVPAHLQGRSRRALLENPKGGHLGEDVAVEWNGSNNGLFGERHGSPGLPQPLPEWMAELGGRRELTEAICDPVRSLQSPDGWKFNCSPRGEHELYDLTEDPGETKNLAVGPGEKARMRDMRDRLAAWQERTGDKVALPVIS